MKKTFLSTLACLAFSASASFGQSFTLMAKDSSGDARGSVDIKTLSYSIDATRDSIWFKLETYNAVPTSSDFGLMIGLDTDQIPTNGHTWPGANTSMKYDKAFIVMMDNFMPGFYYAEAGVPASTNPVAVNVQRPDNYTFIINTQLSKLDPDGKFNLLAGTTEFDAAYVSNPVIYDEVPDAGKGFLVVPAKSSAIQNVAYSINDLLVYPNPCTDRLSVSCTVPEPGPVAISLSASNGVLVYSGVAVSNGLYLNYSFPTSGLSNGVYFLKISYQGNSQHTRVVITK